MARVLGPQQSIRSHKEVRTGSSNFFANTDPTVKWPLPAPLTIVVMFLSGLVVPWFTGAIGLSTLVLLCALYPGRGMGFGNEALNWAERLLVITGSMLIMNVDAVGDLLGADDFRFSWGVIVLATVACFANARLIARLPRPPFICMLTLLAYFILSSFSSINAFRALEINAAYALAFAVVLACYTNDRTRRGLCWKLALLSSIIVGQLAFEMIFPHSRVSISSTQLNGVTGRAAALYANANDCGLIIASILFYVSSCCTRQDAAVPRRLSLITITIIGAMGVALTFSRSAAASYLVATLSTANSLGEGRRLRVILLAVVASVVAITSGGLAIHLLKEHVKLAHDAATRLEAITDVLTGNSGFAISRTLESRRRAVFGEQKYWRHPGAFGQGYGFMLETNRIAPHNMPVLVLTEGGVIGAILFGMLLCSLYDLRLSLWRADGLLVLISSGLLLIVIACSHSVLTKRFFTLPIANVILVTRVLPLQSRTTSLDRLLCRKT